MQKLILFQLKRRQASQIVLSPFHSADQQQQPGALFFFNDRDKAGVLVELELFGVSGTVLAVPPTVVTAECFLFAAKWLWLTLVYVSCIPTFLGFHTQT
jgi:hypothetical protein